MATLGARLRRARLDAGLTQAELAGDAYSTAFVSRIESGSRQPGTEALLALAARLGVDPVWLRRGAGASSVGTVRQIVAQAQADLNSGETDAARAAMMSLDLNRLAPQVRAEVAVLRSRLEQWRGAYGDALSMLIPLWNAAIAERHASDVLTLTRGLLYPAIISGRSALAVDMGTRALAVVDSPEVDVDSDELLRVGATLIWAKLELGDVAHARREGMRWLSRALRIGSTAGQSVVSWNMAKIEEAAGLHARARQSAARTVELIGDGPGARGHEFFSAHTLRASILLRGPEPDPRAALDALSTARSGLGVYGSPVDLADSDVEYAHALLLLGDLGAAERAAESALQHPVDPTNTDPIDALVTLADIQIARGRPRAALDLCLRAVERLREAGGARSVVAQWRATADRLVELGASEAACTAYAQALSLVGVTARRNASFDGVTRSRTDR